MGVIRKPNFCISSPSFQMTEKKGAGRVPSCPTRRFRKFFTIHATRKKRVSAPANSASSTRQHGMWENGILKRCNCREMPNNPHWESVGRMPSS